MEGKSIAKACWRLWSEWVLTIAAMGSFMREADCAESPFGLVRTIQAARHQSIRALAFSADAQRLLSAADRQVTIWSTVNGTRVARLNHELAPDAVAFSPSNRFVLTAAKRFTNGRFQGELKLWDTGRWELVRTMLVESNDINAVCFINETTALTGGLAGLILWDLNRGTVMKTVPGASAVLAMARAPNSSLVAIGTFATWVEEWDISNWVSVALFKGHSSEPRAVAFSAGGQLASATGNGELIVWNRQRAKPELRLQSSMGIWSLEFINPNRILGAGGEPGNSHSGRIWLWAADSGAVLFTTETRGGLNSALSVTRDGDRFATGDFSGTVRLWRLNNPGK